MKKDIDWLDLILAISGGIVFIFMTFQTKAEASKDSDRITIIEEKIDLLMQDRHLTYKGSN